MAAEAEQDDNGWIMRAKRVYGRLVRRKRYHVAPGITEAKYLTVHWSQVLTPESGLARRGIDPVLSVTGWTTVRCVAGDATTSIHKVGAEYVCCEIGRCGNTVQIGHGQTDGSHHE